MSSGADQSRYMSLPLLFFLLFLPSSEQFSSCLRHPSLCSKYYSFEPTMWGGRGRELAAGGWGKKAKDIGPAEISDDKGYTLESRPVEEYELQQPRDFMAKVMEDRKRLLKRKEEDFLAIAREAGVLTDQKGDGVQAMGAFTVDEDDFTQLDMRVYENENDKTILKNSLDDDSFSELVEEGQDRDRSITRMDRVDDVARWGE